MGHFLKSDKENLAPCDINHIPPFSIRVRKVVDDILELRQHLEECILKPLDTQGLVLFLELPGLPF